MNGNNDQGGGGGGRGRGRRRPRHHNCNNNRDHSSNRRRGEHTSSNNNGSSHDDPNDTIRSHNSCHRRSQSPKHARDQNQQGQHHHPPPQSQPIQKQPPHYLHHRKKTFLHAPAPQISKSTLSQILADPIPPLIISFDVENASGTWLGEIWQIGAVCNSASAIDSGGGAATATTDGSGTVDKMESSSSSSSSSSFLVNMIPVGTIHWGVTKHCTNVRVNEDRRTGRRCLWHTIRKEELTPVCIDPATGLNSFLDWIENQRQEYFTAATTAFNDDKIPSAAAAAATDSLTALTQRLPAVILMAHGNLDASNLLNNLAAYDLLPRFESLVAGFVDSQRYLRNGLTAISDRLLPSEMFDAHNALADAQVLYHAVHVKKPSVPQQHQSFLLPASRLALVEPLQDTFMATQDAIDLTKFKVSKLVQKLPPQQQNDTVRCITALLCVDDVRQLDHVVFLDPEKREQRGPVPPPDVFLLEESSQMNTNICCMDVINTYEPNNTTLIAFDVQFTESTGVRSHIHRICAMEVGYETNGDNSDNKHNSSLFDLTCVPPDEVDQLLSLSPSVPSDTKSSTTTRDLLEQFLSWLADIKKQSNDNHIVLCAYGPRQRKWPGLLNHMSYHGLEADFAGLVVGVCDLALAVTNSQAGAPLVAPAAAAPAAASSFSSTSNSNNNHGSNSSNGKNVNDVKAQDKAHGSFCPHDKHGVPILYRANEVCQSNQTIAREIIRRHRQMATGHANGGGDTPPLCILPLLESTITYRSAYANAQILLDQSLGAVIMAGMQFDGYGQAYKGHRLPRMAG